MRGCIFHLLRDSLKPASFWFWFQDSTNCWLRSMMCVWASVEAGRKAVSPSSASSVAAVRLSRRLPPARAEGRRDAARALGLSAAEASSVLMGLLQIGGGLKMEAAPGYRRLKRRKSTMYSSK